MCLCVPAKVIKICSDYKALVDIQGIQRTVAIDFVPEVKNNQYVLIHAGLALSIIEEDEVKDYQQTWSHE